MMFDRYKASFDWMKAGHAKIEPKEGSGPPPAPVQPFDVELKRRLLGECGGMAGVAGPGGGDDVIDCTDLVPEETAPKTPVPALGHEMLPLDSWQALKPAWRGHQSAALKLRNQSEEVKHATDLLRTQILQTIRARNWTRVAISAPTSGCGTTFTSLNLALSISAIPDFKTVLLDLNQRNPGLGKALNSNPVLNVADFLQRRVTCMDYLERYGDNLAVGLSAEIPPNPSEILQCRDTADVLDELMGELTPDLMLFDMPPMLEFDDVSAFLPQVDAVLLVADGTKTLGRQVAKCERMLDGRVPLLGVVLNRGRVSASKAAIW